MNISPLHFFFLFTSLLFHHSSSAYGARSFQTQLEISALTAFKLNLHDPLGALDTWDSTTPQAPCDWRGVSCTPDHLNNNRVTELRLPRLQLGGQLSERLGQLRSLRVLSLRSNFFNGSIPSSLSKCSLLRAVYLQSNSLSGNLPPELGNLTNLQILNLSQNQLSGEVSGDGMLPFSLKFLDLSLNGLSGIIPESIGNLSKLEIMNLSYNRFTGEIPARIGELQYLEFLLLDYNLLEGTLPSVIVNCSSLVELSVNGNSLSGAIPSAIGELPKLDTVSLSQNNLSGSVPVSLVCNGSVRVLDLGVNLFADIGGGKLGNSTCFSVLEVLDLKQNRLHGEFPMWVTNVDSLMTLDLSGNSFSGTFPAEVGNMSRLEVLKLSDNSFSGELPLEIKQCRSLRALDLEGNRFSGEVPVVLGELKSLKMLSLGGNQFRGFVPASFRDLLALELLNLRGNYLNGSFPEELMGVKNLSTLDLSGNKFSGEIPDSIGNLSSLVSVNLSGNAFLGRVPESLGLPLQLKSLDLSRQNLTGELPLVILGLPNLQVIALQENKLSGEIHEGFSSLTGLRYLNLSSNAFTGHIPSSFGYLRSLVVLSLSNNHISGLIPPELGNCSKLEVLELRSNALNGSVPADLSHLSHLKVLDLGRNKLSSEIPGAISKCSSLTSFCLENNRLSGTIPESLSDLSNLSILDVSGNNLTGGIPASLTEISGLTYFNVSRNHLQGAIPPALGTRFANPSAFRDNMGLCGKPLDIKCVDVAARDRRKKQILLIVMIAVGGCLFVLFCIFYIYSLLKWRKRLIQGLTGEKKHSPGRASSAASGSRGSTDSGGPKLVMFNNKITLSETIEATRQFDEENVLSRSHYGLVFKACYNDGMVLSIRRLPDGSLDENSFRKEAEFLSKVKHRNLTVLRGYYAGPPDTRLLVYDYMPNGNLTTLLQEASHQDGHVLNWPMRHLIALGTARGLAFLHTSNIVHRDIKPQNILFDADFEPHISEFGLERLTRPTSTDASSSTTGGTLGYISPEVSLTGETTKASDVYSYGIVLLELLTGKRPVMFTEEEDIVKWVKKQLQQGQITELLEPGLLELDPESTEWEEFLLGIKVGLLCTARDPLNRPTMSDVVYMLEGCRIGPEDVPSSAEPASQQSMPQPT